MNKAELRKVIRASCPDSDEVRRQSEMICAHVRSSALWQNAKTVFAYVPIRREADITPLLEAALREGKTLGLPRCCADGVMHFHQVEALDDLVLSGMKIPEPKASAPVLSPDAAQLLLVPLEGIDLCGRRLGKGGGYYDRYLPGTSGVKMGIALNHQVTEKLPIYIHDIPMQAMAWPKGIVWFEDNHGERMNIHGQEE
ncbi:MAG: 5-formyltetrahydrofolate cyclo-ligase [Clostridia bacterium]|nr:5-formyltetrahydrofolate cyclo-ligase [Clostridia bacterium]